MKKGRLKRLGLLPVLASFAFPAAMYGRLPESVPVHWDWQGEIDAYAQRPVGAFLMPTIVFFIYLLLLALPRIAPREFATATLNAIYERILLALLTFMFFVSGLLTLVGAGMPPEVARYPLAGLGIALGAFGYALVRKTAESPDKTGEGAARTRILTGRLLLGAGILVLAGAVFGNSIFPAMTAIPTALILSLAYAFVLCWKDENAREPADKNPF